MKDDIRKYKNDFSNYKDYFYFTKTNLQSLKRIWLFIAINKGCKKFLIQYYIGFVSLTWPKTTISHF